DRGGPEVTTVTLRRARPDEASMLSDLAVAVKGFWGYDPAFIESCREEFALGANDIARRHFVVADLGGLVAGFYSVDRDPPVGELGNMWIRPSKSWLPGAPKPSKRTSLRAFPRPLEVICW